MLRPALFNNRTYKPMFFDDSFDQMFDNAFKNFWGNNELATFDAFKTDVIDQGDSYLLQAELPGFDKSDINIDLKDSLLTISASHKEEKNEEDKSKYRQRCLLVFQKFPRERRGARRYRRFLQQRYSGSEVPEEGDCRKGRSEED